VILMDSFSALCTESEATAGMDKMQRADGAKLLAKFFRKISNVIPVNRTILIGITHLMGNPAYGPSETKEKGGFALAYQVDVRLRGVFSKAWKTSGEDGEQIGQEIQWRVETTALDKAPGGVFTGYLRYGEGIDTARELFELGEEVGLIKKGGAWYTLDFVDGDNKPKVQGKEGGSKYLKDYPIVYLQLKNKIDTMFGL
jgi:recombination protein RecA